MSLLSANDISNLTGIYISFFDTFKEGVIVVKEPIKTLIAIESDQLWKYGDSSEESNFTYTHVSGVFNCILDAKLVPGDAFLSDLERKNDMEKVTIQVAQDFRNFVSNGVKNQKVLIRDKQFELIDDGIHNSFLTHNMYNYNLKLIK